MTVQLPSREANAPKPSAIDPVLLRIMQGTRQMDHRLPEWARRSNPIVRRQLGVYWKTLPLEMGFWLKLLLAQGALVILAVPFPIIYSLIMPVVTVSVILMPLAFAIYAQALLQVTLQASDAMVEERRNHTLPLLLLTPYTLDHIMFSKIAASIWRQLDNLSLVIAAHVLMSMPVLVLQYAGLFSMGESPVLTALAILLALAGNLVRLLTEPMMVGAIGVAAGAAVPQRSVANIAALSMLIAYFLFVNLIRLLDVSWGMRLLVDILIPLVLPLVVTCVSLKLSAWLLRRD